MSLPCLPHRLTPAVRRGFTVCELLASLACVGAMMALVLPAVAWARESARRAVCGSHLRNLGVAIQCYHESRGALPAAWRSAAAEPNFLWGWATELLPELGERSLADALRRNPAAAGRLSRASLTHLLCPSDITEPRFELRAQSSHLPRSAWREPDSAPRQVDASPRILPTANYVGVFGTSEADDQIPVAGGFAAPPSDGAIVHDRRIRVADLQRGAAVTLLIGERTMAMVPSTWLGVDALGEDAQCRLVGSAMTRPNCEACDECEFGSRHAGGANFLWADGHVELVDDHVDTVLYRRYSQRFAD